MGPQIRLKGIRQTCSTVRKVRKSMNAHKRASIGLSELPSKVTETNLNELIELHHKTGYKTVGESCFADLTLYKFNGDVISGANTSR